MKIIHLSDLHIGGTNSSIGPGSDDHTALTLRCKTIVENIVDRCTPASDYVIIVTGDVTDGGSLFTSAGIKKQYEDAAALVQKFRGSGFIVLPVPGNHDYGCLGTNPKKKYGKMFCEMLLHSYQGSYPILGKAENPGRINNIALIGLNSMEGAFSRDYNLGAQGKLGNPQLKRLKTLLESNAVKAADARVVYLHHHPFSPERNMELHDAEAFRKVLEGKNVGTLLFGHNHNGWKWNGWWSIPRCYDAGTSTRKSGSAGYHRIMDPAGDVAGDYDGDFIGNLKPPA